MKFSLIAAVVLLALAQGSLATDATQITQLFENMKTKFTEEWAPLINQDQLQSVAQEKMAELAAQIAQFKEQFSEVTSNMDPLITQLQNQLREATANVEEQIKPMADTVQVQLQPIFENYQAQVKEILRKVTEQARAIGQ